MVIEKLGLKAGLKVTPPLKSGVTFTHFHIRGMGSMHGGGCRIPGEISGPSLTSADRGVLRYYRNANHQNN